MPRTTPRIWGKKSDWENEVSKVTQKSERKEQLSKRYIFKRPIRGEEFKAQGQCIAKGFPYSSGGLERRNY